jgi:hypothetical protein
MDHAKKLAFVSHMTAQALNSLAQTPNQMSPKGEMSHDKKMDFVAAMTKHGLKHFDTGGAVGAVGGSPMNAATGPVGYGVRGISGGGSNVTSDPSQGGTGGGTINSGTNIGNAFSDLGGAFTTQNTFQAQAPTGTQAVGAQQAQLAGELANESAGNGPNPAQMQYLQNTNNIANQQAQSYASNRALNPGLAARMAGNTGASLESNAANVAGQQQAEQQLAAQQQYGNLTGQEQQGALTAQGINSQISQNNANAVNQTEGGILGGLSGGTALAALAKGGAVKKMAVGGSISDPYAPNLSNAAVLQADTGQQGTHQMGSKSPEGATGPDGSDAGETGIDAGVDSDVAGGGMGGLGAADLGGAGGAASDAGAAIALAAKGGSIHKYPNHLQDVARIFHPGHFSEKSPKVASMAATGGKVKALNSKEKAVKKDNSYDNDKVPAMLSEGEIVLPRSVTTHPMAPEKAAEFVAKTLAKRKLVKK